MPAKGRDDKALREAAALVDRVAAANDLALEAADSSPPADARAIDLLARQLKATEAALRQKTAALLKREQAVAEQSARIEMEVAVMKASEEQLTDAEQSLVGRQASVDAERVDVERKAAALVDEQRRLVERQIEADAGFAAANRRSLESLEQERSATLDSLREARSLHEKRLEEIEDAHVARLHEQRDTASAQLDDERVALATERASLEGRASELAASEARVKRREADLLGDAEAVQEIARDQAARLVTVAQTELEVERIRVEQLRQQVRNLSHELSDALGAARAFGGRTDADVQAEVDGLIRERDALQTELAERPPAAVGERLAAVEAERDSLTELAFGLRRRNGELEARLARTATAANELEAARDRVATLESVLAGYREELATARSEWDALTQAKATATAFPSLQAIDDEEAAAGDVRTRNVDSLAAFVDSLQHRMAVALDGRTLYYDASEIRVFVAGLAASRLHLLQGISGTGKTSLPLAFASATGAGVEVIEVQAGWRDRQDLLGFYNSFEKRFDERRMTQALYTAGGAAYADRPYLIVLDEMNLSHPEQYFADFLSLLERDTDRVELMTAVAQNHPARLIDGRFLHVSRNVWFVGTANRDETTVAFADKTYDRAHVMELPTSPAPFPLKPMPETSPISLQSLRLLFDRAAQTEASSADRVMGYLDTHLAPQLEKVFAVGWSHRLRRIAARFVPVLTAAHPGGAAPAEAEAADHLLATKVLRKLEGRFDVSARDFEAFEESLLGSWERVLGTDVLPTKSASILQRERVRLGG